MKKILISRALFYPLSLVISVAITLVSLQGMLRSAYDSYWLAINRVQTVDFNILAVTSVGTVSEIIKREDREKAQEFVGSNYCLFRMQIMTCEDERCHEMRIMADSIDIDSPRCKSLVESTSSALSIPVFHDSTFPATARFEHAYADKPKTIEASIQPIGYLNLYRGSALPFEDDYRSFIKNWLKGMANASRHDIYKTAALVSILLGGLLFLVLIVLRQLYISQLKRKLITRKLVRLIDRRLGK